MPCLLKCRFRAPEAIELPHDEHVLGAQVGQRRLELRALGAGLAGLLLLEQPFAPSLGQRVALQVEVLVEGGDAGISDEHVGIVPKCRLSGNRKADTFFRQKEPRFGRLAMRIASLPGKRSDTVGEFRERA
jgi:hypothetical protein